jgi:DNA-binding MarR family transcriptional regulator
MSCRELTERISLEVRRSQNRADAYDEAVADAPGINRTDMRCIDVLDQEGRMTAGRLASLTGLTTGAITTVVDRLERAGFAQRVRDERDRRRVHVELTELARQKS